MLQAPKRLATSALITFVPRQVMLHSKSTAAIDNKINGKERVKESKKKKKSKRSKSSETSENCSDDLKTLALDDGDKKKMLLSSIAAFLEINGFHKTLSVFRSEAQIESDGLKASPVNFEDLFCKFLESSRGHEEADINCQKEKDSQKTDASSKDEIEHVHDASEQINKKKRKHKKEVDDGTNHDAEQNGLDKNSNGLNSLGDSNDLEKSKSAEDLHVEIKDKNKKKKKKSLSASLEENSDKDHLEISCEIAKESDANDKAKKKKKHKMSSDVLDENTGAKDHKEKFQEIVEEKIVELKSLTNLPSTLPAESNTKHKGEKKKKNKTEKNSDSLATKEALQESESVKEKAATSEIDDGVEKKSHKKRKRMNSEERASQDENATMAKESKHIKLEGAENNKDFGAPQKLEKSLPDSEHATISKKRKTDKTSESASCQEQDPSDQDVQKESGIHQLANGELQKNEKEGDTASKSKKKENRSAEPKTVNAFQRVKIDEVKFADERLQDNSYWALDGTGSGYGAKAQEVLGQVRGRDFRHEKTKKKRGTYRGGQIDLQAHSIKFNYSDEE